ALICLTRSGFTVRSIARFRPDIPILAFSDEERTVRQLTMSWGATPLYLGGTDGTVDGMARAALAIAKERGDIRSGDLVAILTGTDEVWIRATDTLRLVRVP